MHRPGLSILVTALAAALSPLRRLDHDDIHRIIRQTEQCRGIIKGLLNFARPATPRKVAADLNEQRALNVVLIHLIHLDSRRGGGLPRPGHTGNRSPAVLQILRSTISIR